MYFGEYFCSERDLSPPLIQSDLLNSIEAEMDQDYGEVESVSPTIATLADRAVVDEEPAGVPEADMDIPAAVEAAEARSTEPTPLPTIRKRGRPSLSTSATPVGSVSSKTRKIAGHSTSKRKSVAKVEPKGNQPAVNATPVRKRSRPASDRTKSTAAAEEPAKKDRHTRRRDDAADNGELPAGEYEVEEIVDSAIDADTMEHMYLVKWKGYPASDNTWEPRRNLKGSLELVRKFDVAMKKAEAVRRVAKKRAESASASVSESVEATERPGQRKKARD
ncbi:hypothetical protein VTI28DRAFT_150 [Corynascus sepedonium]